eukprot:scaffold3178_cov109-Isochrysis_galbana.AAC.5
MPHSISQDSLESMFGCIRHACGGGDHPELLKVAQAARSSERRRKAGCWISKQRQARRNSGCTDEAPSRMEPYHAAKRQKPRTCAETAAIQEIVPKETHERWHLREPIGFDAAWKLHLQAGQQQQPAFPHPVCWHTMKAVNEWDQQQHFGAKLFHHLTPNHLNREGPLKMNVGIVIDIFSEVTARGLRFLRAWTAF